MTNVGESRLPVELVNKAQAERWNGPSGRYWIKHRDRHLAEQRDLTPHLFDAAGILQGERVLDVGCGCGDTTIKAAQAATGGAAERADTSLSCRARAWPVPGAVGVDLSAPMLDIARQLATQSCTTNVDFIQGDAQIYPFPPNSFDIVISSFGVMFFSNPYAAFEHLATVVRPDGRLAFLCWQDDTENQVLGIPQRIFDTHLPPSGPDINKLFFHQPEIANLLNSGGWKVADIKEVNEKARVGSDVNDVMNYIRSTPSFQTRTTNFEDQALKDKILAEVEAEYVEREHSDGVLGQCCRLASHRAPRLTRVARLD